MPAPISISPNEHEWIKQYLQETYNITVVDTFDCQALSNAILKYNGTKISCSTFRRLFDLVPNPKSQSRFILNAFAFAVGFKNWELFRQHVTNFDTNVINQNIQIYSQQLPNCSFLILDTIKKLPVTTWLGGYQLQSVIAIAIENKDFDLLKEVVQIPFEIENQKVYEHLVIAFQTFYFQAVKNNEAVIDFITNSLNRSVLLQKCLLQAYVDEKQLEDFLGKWLDAIQENTLYDLLLFKNLLLCQKAFYNQDSAKAKDYLAIALQKLEESAFEIHPILKARIGVWEQILNIDLEKLNTFFNSLNNPFDKADFAVIACRLLWTFQEDIVPISFLEQIVIKEFPPVKDFFQKGRYNMLVLTLAIHFYLKNEFPQAKEYFALYSSTTLGYDIVNVNFYYPWIEKLERL
ncbi:hypothetical protein [Flavobacterium sp.]|jgi:hypothetical protein|uniref:hypothetical protein n=1 Tax=Flavobacterium sp. TaxID=239 RepID=UPI0037C0455D